MSLHANEENFDSPAKSKGKGTKPKVHGCKAKLSLELKAKLEEEKILKIEHDKLEYEVMQTEKIQNSIDKYREKIRDLKKCKEGEHFNKPSKPKIKVKTDKNNLSSPEALGKLNHACERTLQYAGLENCIDKNDFISALLEKANSCCKKQRASRKLWKQKFQLSESSSSDDSSSSSDTQRESDCEMRRKKPANLGSAMRDRRQARMPSQSRSHSRSSSKRRGKLCSGNNEKLKEFDLVMKVKWATAMLGTKHEVSFDQMSFDQYIMGKTQILNR